MRYALAFLGMLATDFLWARYIMRASERRVFSAAAYSAGIVLVGAGTTIIYVADPLAIIPACLGAAAGTVLAVRRG